MQQTKKISTIIGLLLSLLIFSAANSWAAVDAYQNTDLDIGNARYKQLLQKKNWSLSFGLGVDFDADSNNLFHADVKGYYLIDPNFAVGPIFYWGINSDALFFEGGADLRIILPFAETLPLRTFVASGVGYLYRRDRNTGIDFSDVAFRMGGGFLYFPVDWLAFGPEYIFHITDSAVTRYFHTLVMNITFYF